MSADPKHFTLEYSGRVDEVVPVYKYRAVRSGISIAQIEGPMVKSFFCLVTETHDDDGLPEALQSIITASSEDYPYKDVLELVKPRCFGSTSALGSVCTDIDHMFFKSITAGSEGFLYLMPVYLDYILFPVFKESAYMTEVHHINGEGEDGGALYCRTSENEKNCYSVTHREMLREIYPGYCGYKSVLSGTAKNLRESTSLLQVKSFHNEFFRPENLCIIVCGMVEPLDILQAFLKFEEKIVSKPVDRPVYVRPWQSEVPPLCASVERVVKYGCEEDGLGNVMIAWRGPPIKRSPEENFIYEVYQVEYSGSKK